MLYIFSFSYQTNISFSILRMSMSTTKVVRNGLCIVNRFSRSWIRGVIYTIYRYVVDIHVFIKQHKITKTQASQKIYSNIYNTRTTMYTIYFSVCTMKYKWLKRKRYHTIFFIIFHLFDIICYWCFLLFFTNFLIFYAHLVEHRKLWNWDFPFNIRSTILL
jgi:hypothetical protein